MVEYFIQPFISGKKLVVNVSRDNDEIVVKATSDGKRAKLPTGVKKELRRSYEGSKYNGYPIVLLGTLFTDLKNRTSLILSDILLKSEFDRKASTLNYELRYSNLTARFLQPKLKSVKPVFSAPLDDNGLELFISTFVKTDRIDKVVYRKNKPFGYEDEYSELPIWTDLDGLVVGYVKDTAYKREMDENQNVKSETPYDYLKVIVVSYEGEDIDIELTNFLESDKVELLEKARSLLGKRCKFKRWNVQEKCGYILTELEN